MDESKVLLTEYYAEKRQSLVEEATRLLQGDRMTAEDVVQTTFLKLLIRFPLITHHSTLNSKLSTLNSQHSSLITHHSSLITSHSSLLTYHSSLIALVHTTMLNIIRDLWRRRRHEQEYEHQLATAPPWMRQNDDVFSVCSARQITELLEQQMARMDDGVARVMRMNVIDDKAVSEIAQELDMDYKKVENQLQKGRKALRRYMKKAV